MSVNNRMYSLCQHLSPCPIRSTFRYHGRYFITRIFLLVGTLLSMLTIHTRRRQWYTTIIVHILLHSPRSHISNPGCSYNNKYHCCSFVCICHPFTLLSCGVECLLTLIFIVWLTVSLLVFLYSFVYRQLSSYPYGEMSFNIIS